MNMKNSGHMYKGYSNKKEEHLIIWDGGQGWLGLNEWLVSWGRDLQQRATQLCDKPWCVWSPEGGLLPPLDAGFTERKAASISPFKVKSVLVAPVMSDSATPKTVARQAPLSMGFPRQEYWSGVPFPSPGDLSDPGTEPASPTLQADSLLSELPGKLLRIITK